MRQAKSVLVVFGTRPEEMCIRDRMNRVKATLAGFAFLAVIVLLCVAATVTERTMAANAAVKAEEATTHAYGCLLYTSLL